MTVNLKSLVGRLNDTTRKSLEAAAGLCLSRTHYDVEVEHYLLNVLDIQESDVSQILRHFEIDSSRITTDLSRSLDRLKTGNARVPAFSPTLVQMLKEAWTIGSVDYSAAAVRTGFTILALVSDESLSRLLQDVSLEFSKIEESVLRKDFLALTSNSKEAQEAVELKAGAPSEAVVSGKTPNLDQYTQNLTENARRGGVDPVLAREAEIRQMIDILTRRRQNNPILTGEAGVGKTAVVEGFAARVVSGDVPPPLKNVEIHALDLALLQAGAGIKGEFENRLKGLIDEVKSSPQPIILFIDEAHTMIGAGGQAGQGDAANILKPALARGELRTIAATTWSEYKKYFEKDAALSRRFQVVKVDEPHEEQCMVMMRGVAPTLEQHHGVRILDEGVQAAVRLSNRYLAGRQLPDKAVSVLDTACARLALSQSATPPAVEDLTRRLEDLQVRRRVLDRESATGADHSDSIEFLSKETDRVREELDGLEDRYEREKELVFKIRDLRLALEEAAEEKESPEVEPEIPAEEEETASDGLAEGKQQTDPDQLRQELKQLELDLEQIQGDTPLIQACVDRQMVSEVISGWTGIPVGRMLRDEITSILSLESQLQTRVIGQEHALELISQRIRTSRAQLDDPGKPIGVFLLIGPSGVGKTETALTLAEILYGGEKNLITINMSEFQEAHTVSLLKGSPPGYVGYGEGGVLTEAVRRRPYSVVLLDEVEKAHPDVLELFYQVFDKGRMEDAEGREIDFKNTIILLTSNSGTDSMMGLCADPETTPSPEGLVKALKPELDKIFKPAFLGRLVIVPYYPLSDSVMRKIIVLKMGRIKNRLKENHGVSMTYDKDFLDQVAARCTEIESGARNVDNILTNTLLPDVSRELLGHLAEGSRMGSVNVGVAEDGSFRYDFGD